MKIEESKTIEPKEEGQPGTSTESLMGKNDSKVNKESPVVDSAPNDVMTPDPASDDAKTSIEVLDELIGRIDARLRARRNTGDPTEISPDGFAELGRESGVNLLAAYHIRHLPLTPESTTTNEDDQPALLAAGSSGAQSTGSSGGESHGDETMEATHDDKTIRASHDDPTISGTDVAHDNSGWFVSNVAWVMRLLRGDDLMTEDHKDDSGHKNNEVSLDAGETAELIKEPLAEADDKTADSTEDNKTSVCDDRHPTDADGWLVVFSEDDRVYAYERGRMDRPVRVIHSGSGVTVTGRDLTEFDKRWPALPIWALRMMLSELLNADRVAWVPLRPEDVDGLPEGSVFYGFRSRGYAYGEAIDRLRVLGSLDDLDQPVNGE